MSSICYLHLPALSSGGKSFSHDLSLCSNPIEQKVFVDLITHVGDNADVTSVVGRLSHTGVRLVFPLGPQEFGWRSGFQGSTCLQAGCSVRVVHSVYHSLALGVVC